MRVPGSAAFVLAVVLCLQACGAEEDKSGSDILKDSLASFRQATSYRVAGQVITPSGQLEMDLMVDRKRDMQGSFSVDGKRADLIRSRDRVFVRGRDYIAASGAQRLAALAGDQWVLLADDMLARALAAIGDPPALLKGAQPDANLQKGGAVELDGERAMKLNSAHGTVWVSLKSPYRPVRIEAGPTRFGSVEASQLRLGFSDYGHPVDAAPPTAFLDPANPQTLPASFIPVEVTTDCGASGCRLAAIVRNLRGIGTAQATFALMDPAGADLGTCSVPVPETANMQQASISCAVDTPALRRYLAGSASPRLSARLRIRNPGDE